MHLTCKVVAKPLHRLRGDVIGDIIQSSNEPRSHTPSRRSITPVSAHKSLQTRQDLGSSLVTRLWDGRSSDELDEDSECNACPSYNCSARYIIARGHYWSLTLKSFHAGVVLFHDYGAKIKVVLVSMLLEAVHCVRYRKLSETLSRCRGPVSPSPSDSPMSPCLAG